MVNTHRAHDVDENVTKNVTDMDLQGLSLNSSEGAIWRVYLALHHIASQSPRVRQNLPRKLRHPNTKRRDANYMALNVLELKRELARLLEIPEVKEKLNEVIELSDIAYEALKSREIMELSKVYRLELKKHQGDTKATLEPRLAMLKGFRDILRSKVREKYNPPPDAAIQDTDEFLDIIIFGESIIAGVN